MVRCPARFAGLPPYQPMEQFALTDFQQQRQVNPLADCRKRFIKLLCLAHIAWEAVEYAASRRRRRLHLFEHKSEHDVIRHELASTHVGVGLLPFWRPRLDSGSQQFAAGDAVQAKVVCNATCLRSLAGSGRPH